MEQTDQDKETEKVEKEPQKCPLFDQQQNQIHHKAEHEEVVASEMIQMKKQKRGSENRRRNIQAQLKSRRTMNIEQLEANSKIFLDEFFVKHSSPENQQNNSFIAHDLIRLKELLGLVYTESEDRFYQRYFSEKMKESTEIVTSMINQLMSLVTGDNERLVEKIDTFLALAEIIADVIQFIPDKISFIESAILQKDVFKTLLTFSLRDSQISSKFRTNTLLLMASLCDYSLSAAQYFINGGMLQYVQTFMQQKEFDIQFIWNFSWLCNSLFKWKIIQQENQTQLLFCIKSLLWVLYEGLEKISFETVQFQEISNNICESLRYVLKFPLFQNIILNESVLIRVLKVMVKNFCDDNEVYMKMYNEQVTCFYKLFLSICRRMNSENGTDSQHLYHCIEKEDNLRILIAILHNNFFLQLKTLKLSFKITESLINNSPIIFDSLFTKTYINKLVQMLEQQNYTEEILNQIHFLMVVGNEEQINFVMEKQTLQDMVLNILPQEMVSVEIKLKAAGLLTMFLNYGEMNLKQVDNNEQETNVVALHLSRKNIEEILKKEIIISKNKSLVELMQTILQNYYEA